MTLSRSGQTKILRSQNDRLISFNYCKLCCKRSIFLILGFSTFVVICYQLPTLSTVIKAQSKAGYFDLISAPSPLNSKLLNVQVPNPTFGNNTQEIPNAQKSTTADVPMETHSGHSGPINLTATQSANMACKLPNLDPFSPGIRVYLEPPEEVACENVEYPLLFQMENDVLVRSKNIASYDFDQCCISNITRVIDSDDDVEISEKCSVITAARTKIPEAIETFVVSCFVQKQNQWIDVDVFSVPRLRPEVEARIAQSPPSPEAINVVILGLDAISHMNLQRTMPRTHKFLKQNLSAMYFDGHTKVGDNTFPNLLPVLTGKSREEILASCRKNRNDFLDGCPYIWKNYSAEGYRTSLGEDLPQISTFNYLQNGFRSPPTDLYQRPMYLAQDLFIGHEDLLNANVCYGPRFSFDVAFDYMKRLATFMGRDKRYFQFSWVNSLFHDYINTPGLADQNLLLMLIWFQNQGYLDNTAFILMSDHGMRWGDLRETLQGKIEERMPFLYIVLPDRFKSKFPAAINNMRVNQLRLTTHFDTHETLLDLLFPDKLEPKVISEREKKLEGNIPRGISLFLPIPLKRTCQHAAVDDHWCVCSTMVPLDVSNNADVQQGAKAILTFINAKLKKWRLCAQLKIQQVVRAQMKVREDQLMTEDEDAEERVSRSPTINGTHTNGTEKNIMEITIKTFPGLGVFEASVSKDIGGKFKVSGAISRTNLYGKQSHCVKDATIRLYCYCNDLTKQRKKINA